MNGPSVDRMAAHAIAEMVTEIDGALTRVDLRPGDRFVLTSPGPLTDEQVATIMADWKTFCPDFPLLLLEAGAKLAVLSTKVDD